MEHLEQRIPPRRQDRLGACIAFGAGAHELKRRTGAGCGGVGGRAFSQGHICQLMPSVGILGSIPDSVLVVHGPVGCGGTAHSSNAIVRQRRAASRITGGDLVWVSTQLSERDVVNGGETKLEAAIRLADERRRPEVIFVLGTCAPSIIGDDIDAVCERVRPLVAAIVVPVHCAGFKTQVMAQAQDSVYHALARHISWEPEPPEFGVVDPQVEQAKETIRRSRLVNLLNVFSLGADDEVELRRLLEAMGLVVNVYPLYARAEDLAFVTEAALTVSTCPAHDDYFCEFLSERFRIPYVLRHMPVGIANTGEWLTEIAARLGLEAEADRLIAQETAQLESALAPLRSKLKGKRVLISAGEVRTLATASLFAELGMEIVAVRPFHWDRFGDAPLDALLEGRDDVTVNVAPFQPIEAVGLIEKTGPDLYAGHSADTVWAAKSGVPVLPIWGGPNTYCGYRGVFDVARRVVRVLSNTSFNRTLARQVRQPYRAQWYEHDPMSLIVEGADTA